MTITRRQLMLAGTAPWLSLPLSGWAQNLDLAKILVGFPPGGAIDVAARRFAEKMRPGYAKAVVVDNRAGAGGQIAASALKTAPADGSVLMLAPMAVFGIYPFTYKKLPYDPVADFAPVSRAVQFNHGLAVGPAVPASIQTVPEFLAWCRANPEQANFGTAGNGTTMHFIGMLLGRAANTPWRHVAYRGSQPAVQDLVGGQLPAVIAPLSEVTTHLAGGRCRLLATMGKSRSRFFPGIPTLIEQGFGELAFTEWHGFFVPAKTPADTIQSLNATLNTAATQADIVQSMDSLSFELAPSSPAEMAQQVKEDMQRWKKLISSTGFTLES